MATVQFLRALSAEGRCYFTADEAKKLLKPVSDNALRLMLKRLKKNGLIASPARNFYLIISPEYAHLKCLPPEEFIPHLMKYLNLKYYVCLLSAAAYYGAAHQKPQKFQVMLESYRSDLKCGEIEVEFSQKQKISTCPVTNFNTKHSMLAVSTPEMTAFDLVSYPWQAGGLNNIATVLTELAESIDSEKLAETANKIKETASIQRLGYLLNYLGYSDLAKGLKKIINMRKTKIMALTPDRSMKGSERNKDWNIAVNFNIEADI